MKPSEKLNAALKKDYEAATRGDAKAIANIALALIAYRDELRKIRGASGKPKGFRIGKEILANLVWYCHRRESPVPDELTRAVAYWLGLYDSKPRHRLREWRPEWILLEKYFANHPDAGQRQAHRDTGIHRDTIREYKADRHWGKLPAPMRDRALANMELIPPWSEQYWFSN